jgi:hypothetical protein
VAAIVPIAHDGEVVEAAGLIRHAVDLLGVAVGNPARVEVVLAD